MSILLANKPTMEDSPQNGAIQIPGVCYAQWERKGTGENLQDILLSIDIHTDNLADDVSGPHKTGVKIEVSGSKENFFKKLLDQVIVSNSSEGNNSDKNGILGRLKRAVGWDKNKGVIKKGEISSEELGEILANLLTRKELNNINLLGLGGKFEDQSNDNYRGSALLSARRISTIKEVDNAITSLIEYNEDNKYEDNEYRRIRLELVYKIETKLYLYDERYVEIPTHIKEQKDKVSKLRERVVKEIPGEHEKDKQSLFNNIKERREIIMKKTNRS